jgi:hypothetical protein
MWRIGLPMKEDLRPLGVETTSPGSSSTVLRCRGHPAIRSSHRRRRLYTRWSSGPSNWPHGEIVSGLLGHQRMTDRWDLDAPLLVPPKRQLSCLSHLRRLIHARPRRLTRGLQLCTVGCVRPFGGCSTLSCSHPTILLLDRRDASKQPETQSCPNVRRQTIKLGPNAIAAKIDANQTRRSECSTAFLTVLRFSGLERPRA